MRKAVAYYRVSSPRQGESGLGLAAQKRMIRQYCKANNIQLVREFVEVKSGKTARRRIKVLQAIAFCFKHGTELLIATQARLGRNVHWITGLMERGLNFTSMINPGPGADKLQKHIQAVVDENYLDQSSYNTRQSLKGTHKRGGNPRKQKATLRRKRLAFRKKKRPIFQRLYKLYGTYRKVAEAASRRRIKKINGRSGGWTISEVHSVLRSK